MPFDDDFESDNPSGGTENNEAFDSGDGNPQQQTDNSSSFSIPEEYAEKGWTKFFEGKSGDDLKTELFKSYDNQQSLIGKKVSEYLASTDLKNLENYEEIKKSLQAQIAPETTVPEDIKEYALDSVLKDENGNQVFSIPQEALDLFSGKFKEYGLNVEQGRNITKALLDYEVSEFQKYTDADELENNINKMFSGNTEQRRTCESLIKEFLTPEDQQFVQDTMPNYAVEMFYKISKGLVDKYGYKEGTPPPPSSLSLTPEEKNAEYNRLAEELEALDNRPHKAGEKDAIISKMRELFK